MKRLADEEYPPVHKKLNDSRSRNREYTTILASNLPKSYNQSKVRKLFQECGTISRIDVCESPKQNCRLARVEFTSYDEALSALTRSHKKIGNNEIEVRMLENSTLWITNFPPRFSQREIRELLKSVGISVLSVRLPSLRYNSNRRFAYVDVSKEQEVEEAIALLNTKKIEGYTLIVKRSNPLERSKRTDANVWERREILIRHLDARKVTEDDLKDYYSKYGHIEYVKVILKKDDSNADVDAFISFKEQEAASRALETNGMQFQGNDIVVKLADRKTYLERQEVKKLLSASALRDNDCIVSLYPLNDKVNKTHIQNLLQEKSGLNENDIKNIYLVTDLQGCLIILRDARLAAKCLLALNGVSFQNSTVYCGTITDLRKNAKKSKDHLENQEENNKIPLKFSEHQPVSQKQLSNEDFRKMLLNK